MILRSCLFFQCHVLYKNTYVWGVWMVSESVWMMSRLCLRVSEDASMPNLLAKIYIRPWYSDLACSSSVMYCIKTPMRGVSGWCLRVSGWCLDCVWGCINAKSVGKNLYQAMILRSCLFLQCHVLYKRHLCLGCLDGVWECLDDV